MIMIRHFSSTKFHAFGWLAILLIAFLATGCAEKLAPEVETQTEEQIESTSTETIDTTTPETTVQEEGWQIDEQNMIESSNIIESNPNTYDAGVAVEETKEDIQENTQIEVMDLNDDVFVDENLQQLDSGNAEQMDMGDHAFVADENQNTTMENTAEVFEQVQEHQDGIEEAKLLSFGDATQIEDVYFAFDSYDLDSKSQDLLRANADWLKQNPNAQVEVQGHCDERGTNNYNLGLGERRALAIRDFLVAQGVDSSRLHTLSYGEEKPFCFQSNESCWWQNRRAHFQISQ